MLFDYQIVYSFFKKTDSHYVVGCLSSFGDILKVVEIQLSSVCVCTYIDI